MSHRPAANARLTQNDADVVSIVLSHLSVGDNHSRPIHAQLTNAIEQAIFSGQMPENTQLPSVRSLATRLGIAPNTVVRAYRQLAHDGWLRAESKRGYFVTLGGDEASQIATHAAANVKELIDQAVAAAQEAHVSTDLFIEWVRDRIRSNRHASHRVVAVVGYAFAFLEQRVAVVDEALADLPYEVRGLCMEALRSGPADGSFSLDDVACFLVPVGEVREAAMALGLSANQIVPMTRTLPKSARDAIALRPVWTRFGIVSGSERGAGRIQAALHGLHPTRVQPEVAITSEGPDAVNRVLEWSDVVLIGTRARPYFTEHGYPTKPTIEMAYIPDVHALRELRNRLKSFRY